MIRLSELKLPLDGAFNPSDTVSSPPLYPPPQVALHQVFPNRPVLERAGAIAYPVWLGLGIGFSVLFR